jgi:hypothetical protein
MQNPGKALIAAIAAALLASGNGALGSGDIPHNSQKNLYFGETHVHTAYSLDAFLGGTRQTPGDAYRFARGETVVVNGQPHRLRRPLDFAAVTDHAEYLGEMYAALHPGTPGHDHPQIQQLISLTDFTERRNWFIEYVVKAGRARGSASTHRSILARPWSPMAGISLLRLRPSTTNPACSPLSTPTSGPPHRAVPTCTAM